MHGFHPHLNPLPSRERNFIRDYAEDYKYSEASFSWGTNYASAKASFHLLA